MSAFNDFLANMTGAQRTQPLYAYFGWQGGTIHQLAAATGCSVSDLLYRPMTTLTSLVSPFSQGWSAIRTCDRDHRRNVLAPQWQGDLAYWQGVMAGWWLDHWLEETA